MDLPRGIAVYRRLGTAGLFRFQKFQLLPLSLLPLFQATSYQYLNTYTKNGLT